MPIQTIYTDDNPMGIPADLVPHYEAIVKDFAFTIPQHIMLEINAATRYMRLTTQDVDSELFRRNTSEVKVGVDDIPYTLVIVNAVASSAYNHPVAKIQEL